MKKLLLGFSLLLQLTASSKNYFVSGTGNDWNNDGLSINTPFLNLQRAADLTLPGDTVFAMNGTYSVDYDKVLIIKRSGTADKWITYRNYPGHKPKILLKSTTWFAIHIIGASYITIDGFEIEGNNSNVTLEYAWSQRKNMNDPSTSGNGIGIDEDKVANKVPHHIILQNNTVYKLGGGGMGGGGDYITIRNNLVYECGFYSPYGNSGISIFLPRDIDNYTGYKIFVINNISHSNRNYIPFFGYNNGCCITDGNGVILDTYKETNYRGKTLVANNLVYNNGGSGIHSFVSTNIDMVNNTAYMNGQTDPDQYNPDNVQGEIYARSSTNVNILNNIMVAKPNAQLIWNDKDTNVVYDYNLYYNGRVNAGDVPGSGSHDINGKNPAFVDATNANFRLKSESPAVDKGTDFLAASRDFDGIVRPQGGTSDIGAYEFVDNFLNFLAISNAPSFINNNGSYNVNVSYSSA